MNAFCKKLISSGRVFAPNVKSRFDPRSNCIRFLSSSETIKVKFIDPEGEETVVDAVVGDSLLDTAHDNDIELEGACGGELACSTCHLVFEKDVFEKLPEMEEEEEDMLDLAWGLTDTSRLGCQIIAKKELDGMTVKIPDETENMME